MLTHIYVHSDAPVHIAYVKTWKLKKHNACCHTHVSIQLCPFVLLMLIILGYFETVSNCPQQSCCFQCKQSGARAAAAIGSLELMTIPFFLKLAPMAAASTRVRETMWIYWKLLSLNDYPLQQQRAEALINFESLQLNQLWLYELSHKK